MTVCHQGSFVYFNNFTGSDSILLFYIVVYNIIYGINCEKFYIYVIFKSHLYLYFVRFYRDDCSYVRIKIYTFIYTYMFIVCFMLYVYMKGWKFLCYTQKAFLLWNNWLWFNLSQERRDKVRSESKISCTHNLLISSLMLESFVAKSNKLMEFKPVLWILESLIYFFNPVGYEILTLKWKYGETYFLHWNLVLGIFNYANRSNTPVTENRNEKAKYLNNRLTGCEIFIISEMNNMENI